MSEKITPQRVLDLHAVRKPSDWPDCKLLEKPTKAGADFIRNLPLFVAEDGYKPMHDIKVVNRSPDEGKMPQRFILLFKDGSLFYVNTEGYSYCRYALRLPKDEIFPHGLGMLGSPIIKAVPEEVVLKDIKTPISCDQSEPPTKATKRLILAATTVAMYLECKGYPDGTKSLVSMLRDAIDECDE